MKRLFALAMMVGVALSSQAQVGNLVGRAIKKKVEQTVEKKVEDALGVKRQQDVQSIEAQPSKETGKDRGESKMPTPEEVMAMVPQLPTPHQLAEYVCEANRANPRTLKMMTNPTTTFLAKMVTAAASGYVVTMNGTTPGGIYSYDEHLLKRLGITQEQYDAMSEEEQQEVAKKYADELQELYLHTAEHLSSDEGYKLLMDEYSKVEKEINEAYEKADEECRTIWKSECGDKSTLTENDRCNYYNKAVPVQYKAVLQAMKARKDRQLPIAKKMDEYVQEMAKRYPDEVFPGFYNQGGLCATAYVSDAARLTSLSDPQ